MHSESGAAIRRTWSVHRFDWCVYAEHTVDEWKWELLNVVNVLSMYRLDRFGVW